MSSEGSVTSTASRIRQFGLYRTIDARTNEFLKSSRRRQIRQGCACAAISTAITVTVVVSVVLVYEYSINSTSNVNKKISVKPNWLGLMNESDATQTDLKFEKKINFDRATLKLIPILIKALNKNRYLEKIIEDYSSSSPPYEGRNETESYFQRNIFSNTKNWLKIPSPKVYTVDYKSSPLVYTRRPPVNSDYLSRIRKIRNYKRMLDYFDKMISEKVTYSKLSQTTKTDFRYNQDHLKTTTVRKTINMTQPVPVGRTVSNNNNRILFKSLSSTTETITKDMQPNFKRDNQKQNEKKGNCKCPKDMGLLLNKLIQTINDIIPRIASKKHDKSSCASKAKLESHSKKTTIKSKTQQIMMKLSTPKSTTPYIIKEERYESITDPTKIKITTNQTQTPVRKQGFKNFFIIPATNLSVAQGITTQSINISSTNVHQVVAKTQKPVTENLTRTTTSTTLVKSTTEVNTLVSPQNNMENIPMYGNYDIKDHNNKVGTYKHLQDKWIYYHPTNDEDKTQKTTTELIVPLKLASHSNEASLSSESFLDSAAFIPNHKHPIIPLFKDNEYDDYFITTHKTKNDFDDLDVHSFELVKTQKIISAPNKIERNRFKNNIKKVPLNSKKYHPVVKNQDEDINMRKMADLIYLPKIPNNEIKSSNLAPVVEDDGIKSSNFTTRHNKETGLLRNIVKMQTSETLSGLHSERLPKLPDGESKSLTVLDGDHGNNENTNEDEFPDEWAKNVDVTETNNKYNKSIYDDEAPIKHENNYESKSQDKINSFQSMLPSIPPIYLEIRRSGDWKPEDHADYDINLANNIFDLPDI